MNLHRKILLNMVAFAMLCSCSACGATDNKGTGLNPTENAEILETVSEDTIADMDTDTFSELQNMHYVQDRNGKTIPNYNGSTYVTLNDNEPYFTEEEKITRMFKTYMSLDSLGRCRSAFANVCWEMLPKTDNSFTYEIRPTGLEHDGVTNINGYPWISSIDCLKVTSLLSKECGGDSDVENLIATTPTMGKTMDSFGQVVASAVTDTDLHVLYRITPVFFEDDLLAAGVELEGLSVEDQGESVKFHVFAYNIEPGVIFNYETGENTEVPGYQPEMVETSVQYEVVQ